MDDEPALWKRAVAGESAAFGALFDEHRDRVFGQALRLTSSRHEAEDITALVFLEAWRRRASVRVVDGSIIAWLLVATNFVSKNSSRALRRHRAAMESLPPAEATPDFAADVDARLDGEARATVTRAAFGRLSRNDQDIITLCVLEELTVAQAAQTLGVPLGTVKSRLSRAKQRLAKAITESTESTSALGGAR
jgi:RNA polymerase sigma-70 factor (ECF subfamily)